MGPITGYGMKDVVDDPAAKKNSNAIPVVAIDSVEEFHPPGVTEVDLYQKREKIYTRKITGFYQRIRVYTGWPLLLGYFLLPWLNWNGTQAVLFDLPNRQFNIFFLTFWPQDFPLLAWLLIIAAFALFAVTAWLGRVWCGYTCPQTVWTTIYMWAEQWCEGSRNQRIKLDEAPWSLNKFRRKFSKHSLWLGFALLTGLTFVGYFSPIRELSVNLFIFDFSPANLNLEFDWWGLGIWEITWILFFTGATYMNAGWMREQVCMYMCPYARFQSVMFDQDTLIVSYDYRRGENRGARKKNVDKQAEGLGDCVDCHICVQVCPTGIDIRDGLQFECINCALCIDACDSVMEQMGYDKGLISYTTEHALEGNTSQFLRPRIIGYGIAVFLMVAIFAGVIIVRTPLELDARRDRGRLYYETTEGMIENSYTLKILNMDQQGHQYQITMQGLDGAIIVGENIAQLLPGEIQELPLRLSIDPAELTKTNITITFTVQSTDDSDYSASAESRFIGPRI